MIRVYPATKLDNIATIRALEANWGRLVFFNARWLRYVDLKTPDTEKYAEQFWVEDQQDIISCDALMIFGEDYQHLRGALVEAGMALAHGKPVVAVGSHKDFGTWQFHPGVILVENFQEAQTYFTALDLHQLKTIRKVRNEHANLNT